MTPQDLFEVMLPKLFIKVKCVCVGLMWPLFLTGHLYISGSIWQGLQLRMDTQKDVCYD